MRFSSKIVLEIVFYVLCNRFDVFGGTAVIVMVLLDMLITVAQEMKRTWRQMPWNRSKVFYVIIIHFYGAED